MPNAVIATFSTLKYVNAPNFAKFRENWNASFLDGFIVHSKAFQDLKGSFPIGFLIWQTEQLVMVKTPITEISLEIINKNGEPIGQKMFYNLDVKSYLNVWIKRPKINKELAIPLKNAFTTYTGEIRLKNWSDGALAYMLCDTNDIQHAGQLTALFSSVFGHSHGCFVTKDNLWQCAVIFSVRKLIKHAWFNHNDQFLQPNKELPTEFKNDCLIYMLFNGKNLAAGADGLEWEGKKWSLVNHFIPFSEAEVEANDRFESDIMVQYLKDKELSAEAQDVMTAGKELWKKYFTLEFDRKTKDELKLNRPDVGWYQIRKAIKKWNDGDNIPINIMPFDEAYAKLSDKLRPQVYEFGFLRN